MGVEAEITASYASETSSAIFCPNLLGTSVINNAQLVIGGAAAGNNNGGVSWTSTTLGSDTDLWGNTLAVSDVQNPNFGIELQGSIAGLVYCPGFGFGIGQGDNTGTIELDGVNLIVHYATPEEKSFECASIAALSFSIADVGDGATYEWTVPSGMTITNGQNTPSIDANGSGFAQGITFDICVATTDACRTYDPCCISIDNTCESLCSATAPVIAVTDNDCATGADGSFAVTTDCSAGSTLEWSVDGGTTWSATAPTYSATDVVMVIARCFDAVEDCSTLGNSVTSAPIDCNAPIFDLALDKVTANINDIDGDGTISVGDEVVFTITVYNQGTADATDIVVADYLPTGMSFVSSPDFTVNGAIYEATILSHAAGANQSLSITLSIDAGASGTLVNNAEITSADDDGDPNTPPPTDEDGVIDASGSSDDNSEVPTDNDIADNSTGGVDNPNDDDSYDPALLRIGDLLPACPPVNCINKYGEFTITKRRP